MKILNVVQGTPEWHAERKNRRTASEAPAVMTASKYMTRAQLLRQKATGIVPEIDAGKQALFDRGHAAEIVARVFVENLLGEDLFPATCVTDDGLYLASLDGQIMSGKTIMQAKLWSDALAARVTANDLEPHYYWQLEHELYVSEAESTIFICCDETGDRVAWMEYRPVRGRRQQLLAAWEQFEADRAAYQHVEVLPAAVAAPIMGLPAVTVTMKGEIAVTSNLDLFSVKLKEFIGKIDRAPTTDQGFADAAAAVATLQNAEDALERAEAAALSQTTSINDMRRIVAFLRDTARDARLDLNKKVEARKAAIRGEQVSRGIDSVLDHVNAINKRFGHDYLPRPPFDMVAAIKGKRTVQSLRDAIDAEISRAKLMANATADKIQANLNSLDAVPAEYQNLFADREQMVLKDDLPPIIRDRINQQKESEAARLEKERERIRNEEQERAGREAQAAQQAEDALIESIWKLSRRIEQDTSGYIRKAIAMFETGAKDFENDSRTRVVFAIAKAREEMAEKLAAAIEREKQAGKAAIEQAQAGTLNVGGGGTAPLAPATAPIQGVDVVRERAKDGLVSGELTPDFKLQPTPPAEPAGPPTLKLGQIAARLGFSVSGAFLESLDLKPDARDRVSTLYHEHRFAEICQKIAEHVIKAGNSAW